MTRGEGRADGEAAGTAVPALAGPAARVDQTAARAAAGRAAIELPATTWVDITWSLTQTMNAERTTSTQNGSQG
ncbi:MAG: hypothetical protein QOH55_1689 [Microbacteriaceae bacterium]|nr:hypothetical protein [Microbacteriaceae bacterium]